MNRNIVFTAAAALALSISITATAGAANEDSQLYRCNGNARLEHSKKQLPCQNLGHGLRYTTFSYSPLN